MLRNFNKIFCLFLIIFAVGGISWYVLKAAKTKKHDLTSGTYIQQPKKLTSFNLVDSNNNLFNNKNLQGKWTLMFFGYRKCPDICPQTLNFMKSLWQNYFTKEQPVQFAFASIVPEENNLPEFKNFLANYHSSFLGITGSEAEMQKLSEQLAIFHEKLPASNEEQLLIDHSATLLLIDPQTRLRAIFTPPYVAENLAADIIAMTRY